MDILLPRITLYYCFISSISRMYHKNKNPFAVLVPALINPLNTRAHHPKLASKASANAHNKCIHPTQLFTADKGPWSYSTWQQSCRSAETPPPYPSSCRPYTRQPRDFTAHRRKYSPLRRAGQALPPAPRLRVPLAPHPQQILQNRVLQPPLPARRLQEPGGALHALGVQRRRRLPKRGPQLVARNVPRRRRVLHRAQQAAVQVPVGVDDFGPHGFVVGVLGGPGVEGGCCTVLIVS